MDAALSALLMAAQSMGELARSGEIEPFVAHLFFLERTRSAHNNLCHENCLLALASGFFLAFLTDFVP